MVLNINQNMKNKRGWIKIVEAFVAILLITGVVLIVIGKGDVGTDDSFSTIHDIEISILRDIQLNDALREDILLASPLPIMWSNFPSGVEARIIEKTPSQLECAAQICNLEDECVLDDKETDVFAESVIISATLDTFSPRNLKLFCWRK